MESHGSQDNAPPCHVSLSTSIPGIWSQFSDKWWPQCPHISVRCRPRAQRVLKQARWGLGWGGMSEKALHGRGASRSDLACHAKGEVSEQHSPPGREGVYIYSKTTAAGRRWRAQTEELDRPVVTPGSTAYWLCCRSVTRSCLALCDPVDGSTPGFPVLHCLLEFAQTHVHWVIDAIQPSHPLLPFSSCL